MVVDFQVNVNEGTYKMLDMISIFRLKCRTLHKKKHQLDGPVEAGGVGPSPEHMKEMRRNQFLPVLSDVPKKRAETSTFFLSPC